MTWHQRAARRATQLIIPLLLCLGVAAQAAPPDVPPGFERALAAQERHQQNLIRRPGVVGVALGENPAGRPVIQVMVEHPGVAGLPSVLDGEPVQVIVTGRFLSGEAAAAQAGASAPTDRWPKPIPIGVSIAHQDVTAGTIGCQVLQSGTCHTSYFLLSNNHVLANSNAGQISDPILHPGPADGGVLPGDQVGWLAGFEPIVKTTTASNIMDAALAVVLPETATYTTPPDGYGAPRASTVSPSLNLAVRKYGRTTRMTTGRITSLNATVHIVYTGGTAQFVQQFVVTGDNGLPFSQPGDSGSLVVVASGGNARKTVGLMFAGSGNYTAVNPIGPILQRFGVYIAGDL